LSILLTVICVKFAHFNGDDAELSTHSADSAELNYGYIQLYADSDSNPGTGINNQIPVAGWKRSCYAKSKVYNQLDLSTKIR
jgi:hypothetical protein